MHKKRCRERGVYAMSSGGGIGVYARIRPDLAHADGADAAADPAARGGRWEAAEGAREDEVCVKRDGAGDETRLLIPARSDSRSAPRRCL